MPQRLSQPAHLERPRTALARIIFTRLTIGYRAAIALTPKNHPWRTLAKSTFDSMQEMTESTLRPRSRTGTVSPFVERHERAPRRRIALATAMAYLVVAQAIPAMPAVVLIPNGPKLYPFHALGLTEKPVLAPRLRVYVTPEAPSGLKKVVEEEAPR